MFGGGVGLNSTGSYACSSRLATSCIIPIVVNNMDHQHHRQGMYDRLNCYAIEHAHALLILRLSVIVLCQQHFWIIRAYKVRQQPLNIRSERSSASSKRQQKPGDRNQAFNVVVELLEENFNDISIHLHHYRLQMIKRNTSART
jgi:hypothetical protein